MQHQTHQGIHADGEHRKRGVVWHSNFAWPLTHMLAQPKLSFNRLLMCSITVRSPKRFFSAASSVGGFSRTRELMATIGTWPSSR